MRTLLLGIAAFALIVIGFSKLVESCEPERTLTKPFTIRVLDGTTWHPVAGARVTLTTENPRVSQSEVVEPNDGFVRLPALTVKQSGCFNFKRYAGFTVAIAAAGYEPVEFTLPAGDDAFYVPPLFPIRRPQIILLAKTGAPKPPQ